MAEIKIKNKIVKSISIQKDIVSNADYVYTMTTSHVSDTTDSVARISISGPNDYLFLVRTYINANPAVGEIVELNISDFSQITDYSSVTSALISNTLNFGITGASINVNFTYTNNRILGAKIIQAIKNNGKLDLKLVYKIDTKVDRQAGATIDLEHSTIDGVPINSSATPISSLTIDGHKYSFNNDIVITKDDVEKHVKVHTTWEADGTATIDTTAKLQGLDVTYTKSTGIVDGEEVDATVVFDATVVDHINGNAANFQVGDVKLLNPARTITQDDVKTYVNNNVDWTKNNANLDVSGWPALHPGTKLYTPNLHIVKGQDFVYTVQADHGFTVNSGSTVEYTINIPALAEFVIATQSVLYDSSDVEIDIPINRPFIHPGYDKNNNLFISQDRDTKIIYKNGTQYINPSYGNDGTFWFDRDNKLYWNGNYDAQNGLYKEPNEKILSVYQGSQTNTVFKKDGTWIVGIKEKYSTKMVHQKALGSNDYEDLGYINSLVLLGYIDMDKDENVYWASSKNIYKNDALLYTLPENIYSNTVNIYNGDVYTIVGDKQQQIYKNDQLLYEETEALYNLTITNNGNVIYHSDGNVYQDGKIILTHTKVNNLTIKNIAVKDTHGWRTGVYDQ